jgi:MoxR-like ATPase
MNNTPTQHYVGKPDIAVEPDKWQTLPSIHFPKANDPARYVAPKGLADAVNVALHLGMPLLLTGDPGVGKSSLACSLNRELGYHDDDLLHFTVKSDTRDNDLFYSYDTLGRFHAVHGQLNYSDPAAKLQAEREADPRRFIRYQALGMAILLAKGRAALPGKLMTSEALADFPEQRRRAVVLIDEIDKAPRDMPNDILNEIERMEFRIPELFIDQPIRLETEAEKQHRPIVIITSNGERELPEAFLRRCLYYHLSMPRFKQDLEGSDPDEVSVEAIVASRFDTEFDSRQTLLDEALSLFRYLRSSKAATLKRQPSLAEFLDWLRYLSRNKSLSDLRNLNDYRISLQATLLKNAGDQTNIEACIRAWQNEQAC